MEGKRTLTVTNDSSDLLKKLDRGIDDIREGYTLSHQEAMEVVRKLREQRRKKR